MTDHSSPITPPPELVASWGNSCPVGYFDGHWGYEQYIATQAARWGANQELEACCEWVQAFADWGDLLRQDRRPKPPSLKEQALATLESADGSEYPVISTTLTADQHALIRRALETLPDD